VPVVAVAAVAVAAAVGIGVAAALPVGRGEVGVELGGRRGCSSAEGDEI
jgi:hypothetical protein